MKGQILICTAIMLNDHSNPYIESTTVLSDIYIVNEKHTISIEICRLQAGVVSFLYQ